MKRTFHIEAPDDIASDNSVLLCELSHHHVCLAQADGESKTVHRITYYELQNGLEPETLKQLLKAESID